MTGSDVSPSFRLAYVPGVTPTKWVRIWNERLPEIPLTLVAVPAAEACDLLRGRGADAGFVRLPVDRDDLSAIPLYTETTVVVVPKDHVVAAVEEVSAEELADEIVLHPLDDTLGWERLPGRPAIERPATTADAVELVAAGVGVLVVPQSLARLHHRKDLTYRPLTDAPESRVALSWPQDETTDLVEQFIGIVRGRTVNSTRGRPPAVAQPKSKRPAAGGAQRKPAAGKSTGRNPRSGSGGAKGGSGTKGGKNPRSGSGAPKRGKPRRRP
ncbi:LysR substrate-binding domain-containing protein [Streptomyces olivoreticuli]|uniref:LysR substrate-binding domain-containing protein n=1 Tax=Streptomyces olivoreticuli TaxID=68246 RepID=UPI002659C392|nr:LysR substrate-binding domain-containing protein [Streptomyces olivoreticuli]WKK25497.1 LysR substrate-binding domain-containing protein [Streptomyces olivoreticuli]